MKMLPGFSSQIIRICALMIILVIFGQVRSENLLDQMLNTRDINKQSNMQMDYNQTMRNPNSMIEKLTPMIRGVMKSMLNVGVPSVYEMNRTGNGNMGINVLSGLVKVERGSEAERNGLVGPRPLSVRVFGVPIYERGRRIRPVSSGSRDDSEPKVTEASGKPNSSKDDGDDEGDEVEELPIDP